MSNILSEFPSPSKMKNNYYLSIDNDDGIDMKSPTTQKQHSRKHKSISPLPFNFLNDDKNDNFNEGMEYNVQNCIKKKTKPSRTNVTIAQVYTIYIDITFLLIIDVV